MKRILNNNSIIHFGYCKFDVIYKKLIKCKAISKLPLKSQTVIVAVFPYYTKIKNHNIARFAIPKDYHITVYNLLLNASTELKKTFPENEFVPFTDNSPIPEVYSAIKAGLGVRGKNGLLITPQFGSWVIIGEIVTDLHIDSKTNDDITCIACDKCIKSCPSGALSTYGFDKSKCISHISQKKGVLSDDEIKYLKSGVSVWGCDICQECCPMNKNKESTYLEIFKTDLYPMIKTGDYDKLTQRAFKWRPKETIERNLNIKSEKL